MDDTELMDDTDVDRRSVSNTPIRRSGGGVGDHRFAFETILNRGD